MKTLLGTEVDLGTGHIVLDLVPAVRETWHNSLPLLFIFAHVYCGHSRPAPV